MTELNRQECEKGIHEFAQALGNEIAHWLEEKTAMPWHTIGHACFLNWCISFKSDALPFVMEIHDRMYQPKCRAGDCGFAITDGSAEHTQWHIEDIGNTVMGYCKAKCELSNVDFEALCGMWKHWQPFRS